MNDILTLIEANIAPKNKLAKKEDLYCLGIELLKNAGYNKPVEHLNNILKNDKE